MAGPLVTVGGKEVYGVGDGSRLPRTAPLEIPAEAAKDTSGNTASAVLTYALLISVLILITAILANHRRRPP
jgi:hypothetical protein